MNEITYRTRSEFAEAAIHVDGRPINFDNYPMFRAIYDGPFQNMLLMTCRQVGKSTTIGSFEISESALTPHFKNLFVAPSKEQTHRFSTLKVGKMINYSPIIKKLFVTSNTNNRVFSREFSNGAEINFSYADDDADRCRGLSCDRLCLDEIQDMILDVVGPVIKECLSESPYKYQIYCGTPKTNENGIESYWRSSTQTEWVMKCTSCGRHSAIRSEKQFGKFGPVCTKCQAYLNPRLGFWYDMNKEPDIDIKGFHISRAIMPKVVPICWPEGPLRDKAVLEWKNVLNKLDGAQAYPLSKFRNEVIGVSDSQGRRLVTIEDLKALQTGPMIQMKPSAINMSNVVKLAAGVDWSGGGTKLKSRTILTVIGRALGINRLMYYKIFPGTNPVDEVNEIYSILQMYNLNDALYIGCDAGEGNLGTDLLRKKFSSNPKKVIKFRYSGALKAYIKWDEEANGYLINRTACIDSLMTNLKSQLFQFPKEYDMSVPFNDILNEYEEVTKEGRKYWSHSPDKPDDFLHSLNFAKIALQIAIGELDLTASAS